MQPRPPLRKEFALYFCFAAAVFSFTGCLVDFEEPGSDPSEDGCPGDPLKTAPGECGCGVSDDDVDSDGTPDCLDGCPGDPDKVVAGTCGCGTPDSDRDGDKTLDCLDECPGDPEKTIVGPCGCGTPNTDKDGDGTPDCIDDCPSDPQKTAKGICGCGETEDDRDGDGTPDCTDNCPGDPQKTSPGICGCGLREVDPCDVPTSLKDARGAATGVLNFELSTGRLPLYVDGDYDSGGWVLIGRGREGFAWTEEGAGDPATLNEGLGTPAAFLPAYLSTATIQELIGNSGADLTQVDIRIKRAAATDGSVYQEVSWLAQENTDWTWLLDSNPYSVSYVISDSALGTGSEGASDTRDNMGLNDQNRVFTWAWSSHSNKRGFSYGSAISGGTADPDNFFWQAGGEDHAIPYTEVYLRDRAAP